MIYKKRSEIVNGSYEPTDEESNCPGVDLKKHVPAEGQDSPQGIPNFWLGVLKNVREMNAMIHKCDEEALKYLTEIRAFSTAAPNLSFQLEFHFSANPFFQNSVLTKTYLMKCTPNENDPFSFEGPEIYKSIGCEIMWSPGKEVAEMGFENENDSNFRIYKSDTFFNFFNPPELHMIENEESDRIESYLENDFEIGHFIKERVIPRAVLYFLGEIDDDISDADSIDFNADDEDEDDVEVLSLNDENTEV